jgi:hypothetical protein
MYRVQLQDANYQSHIDKYQVPAHRYPEFDPHPATTLMKERAGA